MKIEYPYSITKEQAYEKINDLLPKLQAQYSDMISNPKWHWNNDKTQMDFSLEVKGFDITGKINLEDGKLVMDGDLPLLAKPFESTIEGYIRKELDGLLK